MMRRGASARRGEGLSKTRNRAVGGSVSGAPCGTAMGDGGKGSWGSCRRWRQCVATQREVTGFGGLGEKPKTEPLWFGFGLLPGEEGPRGHRNPSHSNLRG